MQRYGQVALRLAQRHGSSSGTRGLSVATTTCGVPDSMTAATRNYYPLTGGVVRATPVMMLRGASDTIGDETMFAMTKVLEAAGAPVEFRTPKTALTHEGGVTEEILGMFAETKVALKGPYYTPLGHPRTSVNIELRCALDLFANVVHAYNIPGVKSRHENVDVVIIRENTEGEYSGLEHQAVPGVVESLKIITRERSMRIAQYAFQYAVANRRRKVTAVHKANIMKSADGLFLECCEEVASQYPYIEFDTMIVDNTCMQMTSRPQQFDVMLLPNLYGNIVTNIATGLVGGPGLFPGANIGEQGAIFEQGARHSARDIAGQQICNPTATILAGVLMLRHLKMDKQADVIERAVSEVYRDTNIRTRDVLNGDGDIAASTDAFTDAIIQRIDK